MEKDRAPNGAGELLSASALAMWLGYERLSHVERWLRRHDIPYFHDKEHRPVTTATAINTRLLASGEAGGFEFED